MTKEIVNYDGAMRTSPAEIIYPETVAEIQAVLRDRNRFPSPVRAMGSFHSLTPCACADGGTVLRMSRMTRLLRLDAKTNELTAEAGLTWFEAAKVLRQHQLQFATNLESGSLTLGSAACCHTRDALDSARFGQASSYVTRIKWVTPTGELAEASSDAELALLRSSHGLCGVIYEVTFQIKPLEAIHLTYTSRNIGDLTEDAIEPMLEAEGLLCWVVDRTVIFQQRQTVKAPVQLGPVFDAARRQVWSRMEGAIKRKIDSQDGLVYSLLNASGGITLWNPERIMESLKFTFSCWAFPKEHWLETLRQYLDFADAYQAQSGFRCNLPLVCSLIRQDRSALLSYSYEGDVITLEPHHSGGGDITAWQAFLRAFNAFAAEQGGIPFLNQTPLVEREHVEHAYGARWAAFSQWVSEVDKEGRMVNPFFESLLSGQAKGAHG